jgi:hypothetical protein
VSPHFTFAALMLKVTSKPGLSQTSMKPFLTMGRAGPPLCRTTRTADPLLSPSDGLADKELSIDRDLE